MSALAITMLDELAVHRRGEPVVMPASRKTRALLAYLVLTGRPHRRDRLCELFWEIPDDPRGALRWSLSKLRRVVNEPGVERLAADRERVVFIGDDVEIDVRTLADRLDDAALSPADLLETTEALRRPLLDGCDLPDQTAFQSWLVAERREREKLLVRASKRLSSEASATPEQVLHGARVHAETRPYDPYAALALVRALRWAGERDEAHQLLFTLAARFREAGIAWPPEEIDPDAPDVVSESTWKGTPGTPREPSSGMSPEPLAELAAGTGNRFDAEPGEGAREHVRHLLSRQTIRFCSAADGARIAYATVGEGSPLVKAANWLSHLELDWDAPIWSPLFRELAHDHTFVRYDERGNGLSDWEVGEISFETWVTDLETVVDALGLERFPLLGISQGASVSIEYAARHPERVSHLILFGAYAAGWRHNGASPDVVREREAVITLTEAGWGQANPAYRHIFSSGFMPSASARTLDWFDEFQRRTTSPANAARFLEAFGDIDVRHRLADIAVPTLVLHSLGDQRCPVAWGRDIAAEIPGAEFVGLESDGHLLVGDEPASRAFVEAVRRFLA